MLHFTYPIVKSFFKIQDRITPEMLSTISRLAAFEMHIIRLVSERSNREFLMETSQLYSYGPQYGKKTSAVSRWLNLRNP